MIIDPYTWHTTRITEITPVAHDTITIRVNRPAGYRFAAGQYAITRTYVTPTRFLVRQYSFSSPPSAEWLEFTIQREPGGEVTTWLHGHARVGDMMEISQSFGHFTFEHTERPLLFIAGRVGIAPFMSHLREASHHNVHILYSMRSEEEYCFRKEIESITTPVITTTQPRIDRAFLAQHVIHHPIVYICGSRQFAEAIQTHLNELGLPPADIRRELFTL